MPQPIHAHGRRLSVCQITTRSLSLEQDLDLYARSGIEGISFWSDKIAGRNPVELKRLVGDAGLVPVSLVNLPHFVSPADRSPTEARVALLRWLDLCHELAIPVAGCVPGNSDGRSAADLEQATIEALRELAPEAEARGVTLAIEPIRYPYVTFLNFLHEADRIVRAVDSPWVKTLFDCWHLCHEPDLLNRIEAAGDRIGLVHFSDYRAFTRQHDDRLLPGDGIMPLKELLQALDAAGYRGFYDVEIFSPEVWSADPAITLGRLRDYFDKVWSS